MNGSGSIQFLPSDCFLSDAFVVFSQKVAVGHFSMFQTVTSFQGIPGTGFKPSRRDQAKGSKRQQRAAKGSKAKAAAGAQTPLAGKHFADFLLPLAAVFFFPWDLNFAA